MEATIKKVLKVADKAERLALQPKIGYMAVQRDIHERFYFDGYRWRLFKPGTDRHWRNAGKPQPVVKKKEPETKNETPQQVRTGLNLWWIAGVIALAIIIILLINAT